jgi:signal peptidase I
MRRHLRLASVVAVSAGAAWLLVQLFRFSFMDFARVSNESMLPHLKPGQIIVISKLTPCLRLPFTSVRFFCRPCETGRAYLFAHPSRPWQRLVKFATDPQDMPRRRDIIWFTQGAEHRAQSSGATSCYFEGSNREGSIDSRHFGRVPLEKIDGKIIYPRIAL